MKHSFYLSMIFLCISGSWLTASESAVLEVQQSGQQVDVKSMPIEQFKTLIDNMLTKPETEWCNAIEPLVAPLESAHKQKIEYVAEMLRLRIDALSAKPGIKLHSLLKLYRGLNNKLAKKLKITKVQKQAEKKQASLADSLLANRFTGNGADGDEADWDDPTPPTPPAATSSSSTAGSQESTPAATAASPSSSTVGSQESAPAATASSSSSTSPHVSGHQVRKVDRRKLELWTTILSDNATEGEKKKARAESDALARQNEPKPTTSITAADEEAIGLIDLQKEINLMWEIEKIKAQLAEASQENKDDLEEHLANLKAELKVTVRIDKIGEKARRKKETAEIQSQPEASETEAAILSRLEARDMQERDEKIRIGLELLRKAHADAARRPAGRSLPKNPAQLEAEALEAARQRLQEAEMALELHQARMRVEAAQAALRRQQIIVAALIKKSPKK